MHKDQSVNKSTQGLGDGVNYISITYRLAEMDVACLVGSIVQYACSLK